VGVNVDPAGRDQQARGVDCLESGTDLGADRGHDANTIDVFVNSYVDNASWCSGAVDHVAIANYQVMHEIPLCVPRCSSP